MPSRLQVKVHINRALRARAVEQKLDEIAIAINELARYVEELEKESLSRSAPNTDTPKAPQPPGERLRRSLAKFAT
jgi:hypothetical protein